MPRRSIGRTTVGETVLLALARLGTAGAEALFGMLERCGAKDRSRIIEALARSEARDDRIRTLIVMNATPPNPGRRG